MKMRNIFLLCCLIPVSLFAQRINRPQEANSGFIRCTEFHVTRPLREIVKDFPVDEDRVPVKKESEDRENRKPQRFVFGPKDGRQYGNDSITVQRRMGGVTGRAPIANWVGQSATGFRPMDPSGAPGPQHYVQMINSTTFKVYNKSTGAVLLTSTFGNLWSPATPNDGDPIVLYDRAADRWFLAQFGQTGNKMYIAVSTSGDPTGTYYTYTFTSPEFPDYLKFSVWTDGYYMTSNQTQRVFAFERTAMLAGNAGARAVYTGFSPPQGTGFFVPLPGDASDGTLPPAGTPCPIFSYSDNGWGTGYSDAVNIYQMAVNWTPATPTGTITLAANIPTAAFDASYDANWNDVIQPGTTQKLDGIGGVCMYRAQWKSWSGYNTILLNWAVKISATQRSIKWCELRQSQSTGTWSMYQEGIYTPDAATRWMGSIAMDNNGSIGLAYMKTNSATTLYPGLYYTGRRSCDPLGTLPITEEQVVAGTGYQTGGNRNGDYAQLSLDPDGVTFWYTGEYMGGTSGSTAARTRIFSFQLPVCENTAIVNIAITNGVNPKCPGTATTFTATPTNGGTAPAYQWQVNGINVGTNSTTYSTSTLTNGDVVRCIMTSNLSGVLGSPATSNTITMTVSPVVTPSVSIALTSGTNPACSGTSLTFTATPTNGGTTPTYLWKVDGVNAGTNSNTFTTASLTNGQVVSCTMTSNALCTSSSTANSNTVSITINPTGNPTASISQTGGTNPLCAGSTATFTATVNGGTATAWQWKVDGVNAGTSSSTFSSSTLTNGQVVSCVVTANASCPNLTSYVLGTGTTSNSTTSGLAAAYPTYYGNGRQQYLIRASELTALGMSAGNIQSIAFRVTGSVGDPATLNGYRIRVGTTTTTAYSSTSFLAPTFTTVFGPQNFTPVLGSWNTHNFSTPFNWNGTTNLLIDICFSNQVVGNAAYQTFNTATSFVSTDYYQADGTTGAGACTQTTGTTGSSRPNMTFQIGNLSANVTSNTITINTQAVAAISSVTPSAGPAASRVDIAGSGFVNVSQVTFNSIPASSYTVSSATAINAIVPGNGGGNVAVTTNCGTASLTNGFTLSNTMNLTVQVLFEGFYRGSGTMTNTLGGSNTDTADVALASSTSPYNILFSSRSIINTSGSGVFTFTGVPQGYSYYLVVRHRNSMETWSAAPLNFNNLSLSYDFSSSASSSYGSNVKSLGGGRFGLYSGDVNQDDAINLSDLTSIASSTPTNPTGYRSEDITGDLFIESADYSLVENNYHLLITVSRP